MYRIINFNLGNRCIKRLEDCAYIPFANDNADYQEYLKWVAEGNEAEVEEVNN